MNYLFDSFDKAIAGILDVDVQDYCSVMDNLYKVNLIKWRSIIDGAKSGSIEDLNKSKKIFALCLEQSKN